MKIAVALGIIAAATKIIGSMDEEEMFKGLAFILALKSFIKTLVVVSKFARENATKAGVMLLGVAAAIGIMGLVIKMVGTMETGDLLKGIAVVAVLESFIIGMIAVSKLAGENAVKAGSMVLKISASLLIMTAALFLLDKWILRSSGKRLALLQYWKLCLLG